jgi:hypothetical protein
MTTWMEGIPSKAKEGKMISLKDMELLQQGISSPNPYKKRK